MATNRGNIRMEVKIKERAKSRGRPREEDQATNVQGTVARVNSDNTGEGKQKVT